MMSKIRALPFSHGLTRISELASLRFKPNTLSAIIKPRRTDFIRSD